MFDRSQKALLKNHPEVEEHWDQVHRIRMIMETEGVTQEVALIMDDHKVTREIAEKWVNLNA